MADATTPTTPVAPPGYTLVPIPPSSSITPGYKTTEFWKSSLVTVFGLVMASGLIPSSGFWGQIGGLIASVLATTVYTQSRAAVKAADGQ